MPLGINFVFVVVAVVDLRGNIQTSLIPFREKQILSLENVQ
jgi:hypothetical protein